MHAHHAELRAAVQCGDSLAGIEQTELIERMLDRVEDSEFRCAELHTHLVDFLHTHAMLPGDSAADLHAQYQYRRAELLGTPELIVVIRIEHDQRMQVAITGVKHVSSLQGKLLRASRDAGQYLAQPLAWDGAVHAEVVGHDAAHCGERCLST